MRVKNRMVRRQRIASARISNVSHAIEYAVYELIECERKRLKKAQNAKETRE